MRAVAAILSFGLLGSVASSVIGPLRDTANLVRQSPLASAPPPPLPDERKARDVDVVLILGESTSRWHLQLYGYPYPTTPRLAGRKSELVVLTDAVSTYSHTLQSVSSLMFRPNASNEGASQTLLGELKSARVRTAWLSSQAAFGPWDSPIRTLANEADVTEFFTNREVTLPFGLDYQFGLGGGFTADQDMTDQLVNELGQERPGSSLTVAHLTAGHIDYCRNIPHEVRRRFEGVARGPRYFGNASDRSGEVNCYDAAMTLVDDVVDRVMEAAKRRSRPTVVIFTPDHGEDPDGGTGHSSAMHSARHVEIPIIFYFNEAAQTALPEQFAQLREHKAAPFAMPWLHESILDLFGLNAHYSEEPSLSIVSPLFHPVPRVLFADSGSMSYDEPTTGDRKDYLSRTRLALKSIQQSRSPGPTLLAHRNDSELALQEAMQSFAGAEMDVVFDVSQGRFLVYHPPAEPTGYTLERALEIAQSRPDFMFWFDWKDAGVGNLLAGVKELERLDQRFKFKQRAIVETDLLHGPGKSQLFERGFLHSYYLQPTQAQVRSCGSSLSDSACRAAAAQVAADAKAMRAAYVSFDRSLAPFAQAVLLSAPQLQALTWDLSIDSSRPGMARVLLRSPPVKLELIRLPSRFWR